MAECFNVRDGCSKRLRLDGAELLLGCLQAAASPLQVACLGKFQPLPLGSGGPFFVFLSAPGGKTRRPPFLPPGCVSCPWSLFAPFRRENWRGEASGSFWRRVQCLSKISAPPVESDGG